jgi:hypothetical protein
MKNLDRNSKFFSAIRAAVMVVCGFALLFGRDAIARAQSQPTNPTQAQPATAASQQPTTPPDQTDTGGPAIENGPIVIPKKKESEEPPPPAAPEQPKIKNPNGETYSITVNVPEVHLDVSVILDKNHQFVPGLKPPNFLVLEDGVEQKVDTVRIA